MSINQEPYNGETRQLSTGELMVRNPMSGDEGISGIQRITETHVACVLLLDTSGSMADDNAIGQLCAGLETFKQQTMTDPSLDEVTRSCIDVALVSFGPDVRILQDFVPVKNMKLPRLKADGGTPMGEALNTALDLIAEQKERYNMLGTPYYRPWIYCITDGAPNDEYEAAFQRLRQMEAAKKVCGYCVGVRNFDRELMTKLFNPKRVFVLENQNFTALFEFLSRSVSAVTLSDPAGGNKLTVNAPMDLHPIEVEF